MAVNYFGRKPWIGERSGVSGEWWVARTQRIGCGTNTRGIII